MNTSVVSITESAKKYIAALCKGSQLLLVRVNNKGCSGHQYEYSLVDKISLGKFDEIITWSDGGFAISADSVMHLIGSTLDLETTIVEEKLVWKNPQAINQCGCGLSFSIDSSK